MKNAKIERISKILVFNITILFNDTIIIDHLLRHRNH